MEVTGLSQTYFVYHVGFSDAFTELRKAAISFVMSVRPSIRPSVSTEQLNSHWTNFHEFSYLSVFRKSVEKIQVALKPGKNNGYIYMKTYARLWKCPAEFLLE